MAAVAMVIYSSPPVVARAVSVGVPPLALSLSRWVIALVLLLPFVWRKLPGEWPKIRTHLWSLTFMILFMVGGSTMSVLAVYYTTATNAVLVNASQPAITGFFAWAITGATLLFRQRLGIVCAFLGILVMIARADLAVLLAFDVNIGDFIMLLAVIGWSTYAVLLPKRDYKPPPLVLMFMIAVIGTICLLPAYLIESRFVGPFDFTPGIVAAMFYLSIFPTILATLAWNAANIAVGPNRTAIFVNLIPVSGAVLAMIFLGERLFTYHLIGAAFVFVGIYLAVRRVR
jgi:drug/metabolite transporter (DMT)-like permease